VFSVYQFHMFVLPKQGNRFFRKVLFSFADAYVALVLSQMCSRCVVFISSEKKPQNPVL